MDPVFFADSDPGFNSPDPDPKPRSGKKKNSDPKHCFFLKWQFRAGLELDPELEPKLKEKGKAQLHNFGPATPR